MASIITIPSDAIVYDINLDLYGDTERPTVYTKQYDSNTRYIRATIWNNGIQYKVPLSKTIAFACTKTDGKGIYNEAELDNEGKIVYKITDQTTIKDGRIDTEFRIYDTETVDGVVKTKLASTPKFKMFIDKSAFVDGTIESTNEFNVLTNLISTVGDLEHDVSVALEQIQTAVVDVQTAVDSIGTSIVDANTATTNANTATSTMNILINNVEQAETVRQTNEINRETNTTTALNNVTTAITNAETATEAALQAASGVLPNFGTVGTYTKVTTDDKGRIAEGSNPTDIADFGITNVYTKDEIDTFIGDYSSVASNYQNNVYTVVDFTRSDDTLYMKSTLSNPDTNYNYQTCTLNYYDVTGTTIERTVVWTFTYDENGKIVTKVVA